LYYYKQNSNRKQIINKINPITNSDISQNIENYKDYKNKVLNVSVSGPSVSGPSVSGPSLSKPSEKTWHKFYRRTKSLFS
jgi:hypothetical protein